MKIQAALLYAPKHIRIEQMEIPGCKEGQVVVAVKKATLCPTDIKKYLAIKPEIKHALEEKGPCILGHEAAGIVVEAGSKVQSVRIGDAVAINPMISCGTCAYCRKGKSNLCQNIIGIGASAGSFSDCIELLHTEGIGGCFASHVKVPESCIVKLPPGLPLAAGSLMEPLADVVHSVDAAKVAPGDTVVVIGLGPMGLFHVIAAKYNGAASLIGIDIDDTRLECAKNLGADYTCNSANTDAISMVSKITSGLGADKIFVTSGGKAQKVCAEQALRMVGKLGTVSLFASASPSDDDLVISMNHIHYNMIMLQGTVGFRDQDAQKALDMLAQQVFDYQLIRNKEMPLEQIEEAMALYGKGENLKIGLAISGE